MPAEYDILVDFSPVSNSDGTKEINEYASIKIEAQYFKKIDIETRANLTAFNVFRPDERDLIDKINSLREKFRKWLEYNKKDEKDGNQDQKDISEMIEVDLSGFG